MKQRIEKEYYLQTPSCHGCSKRKFSYPNSYMKEPIIRRIEYTIGKTISHSTITRQKRGNVCKPPRHNIKIAKETLDSKKPSTIVTAYPKKKKKKKKLIQRSRLVSRLQQTY